MSLEKDNLIEMAEWAIEQHDGNLLAELATQPRNWLYNVYHINEEWLGWLGTAVKIGITKQELEAKTLKLSATCISSIMRRTPPSPVIKTPLPLFQPLATHLGEANARQVIGDVQRSRNDYCAALASYRNALSLFQTVDEPTRRSEYADIYRRRAAPSI